MRRMTVIRQFGEWALRRPLGLLGVAVALVWACGPDAKQPVAPRVPSPGVQPIAGQISHLAAGIGGAYLMAASGNQVDAIALGPTGLIVPTGMPSRVVVGGAITREPTPGLLFFCSTVEWQWACQSMWQDLVSDAPIPPAGIWGVYARASVSWDGAPPGSMAGDSDLTLPGVAGTELWAGRSAFACYYELSVKNPDGSWKYPYDYGPCHTFGGGFTVTVQPDDGGGALKVAATPNQLPGGGGSVTFVASAADGSTLENVTWQYLPDAVGSDSAPVASPPERGPGAESSVSVRAALERGDVYTVGADHQLVRGRPAGGGIVLVKMPIALARQGSPRKSPEPRAGAPRSSAAAANSTCDGSPTCVQAVTKTGSMVVQATLHGQSLAAAARVTVGGGGGAALPTIVIVSAAGPKVDGSFVAGVGENQVTLVATVVPDSFGAHVVWDVHDDPADEVTTQPPTTPPTGASTSFLVPQQTLDRWTKFGHPGDLVQKSLGYEIRATVMVGSTTVTSDAVKVRQNEIDTMEQEYEDYGVDQPPIEYLTSPVRIPHFSWEELNHGDYGYAFLNPVLMVRLPQLRDSIGAPLALNSAFRNPVHHRFHPRPPAGTPVAEQSYHQAGAAVDIATSDSLDWRNMAATAKTLGLCIEPVLESGVGHLHADFRGGRDQCPQGW